MVFPVGADFLDGECCGVVGTVGAPQIQLVQHLPEIDIDILVVGLNRLFQQSLGSQTVDYRSAVAGEQRYRFVIQPLALLPVVFPGSASYESPYKNRQNAIPYNFLHHRSAVFTFFPEAKLHLAHKIASNRPALIQAKPCKDTTIFVFLYP